MRYLRKLLPALLTLLLLASALAESAPGPVEFATLEPAQTSAPDSTGVLFPTLSPAPTPAPVVPSALEDDGMLRVLLLSLGAPKEINLRFAGEYAVEGDPGFRFDSGSELAAFVHDDEIWFGVGGLSIAMGESVTLTRHASGDGSGLFIAESEKNAAYNGDLTLSVENGALRCVLRIFIEEYLLGVVAYEMSDSFPIEALKAQAVAARTYALDRKLNAGGRDYDVMDTTADQVFKGYDASYENVAAAVEATRGVVGVYNGAPAVCYYTASNGGQIMQPTDIWGGDWDDGYIEMRDDPYDVENPNSVVKSVEFAADLSDNEAVRALLESKLTEGAPVRVRSIRPVEPALEGSYMYTGLEFELDTIVEVPAATPAPDESSFSLGKAFMDMLSGSGPETVQEERVASVTLSVYDEIKNGLGLKINGSDYELVSVRETETGFVIEMRRFGHGVGMSQRGAQWMAGQYAATWQEILGFYYPGMSLERIGWEAPALTQLDQLPVLSGYHRPEPTPRPTPAPLPALEPGEYYASVRLEDPTSALNIREQPNTGARILDRFAHGREVIVCTGPDANGWVQIRTAELTGYTKLSYLAD